MCLARLGGGRKGFVRWHAAWAGNLAVMSCLYRSLATTLADAVYIIEQASLLCFMSSQVRTTQCWLLNREMRCEYVTRHSQPIASTVLQAMYTFNVLFRWFTVILNGIQMYLYKMSTYYSYTTVITVVSVDLSSAQQISVIYTVASCIIYTAPLPIQYTRGRQISVPVIPQ